MSGNDLYIRRQLRGGFFHRIDHALHAAPAGHVNERKAVTHKVVAHVHDIIFRKENNGIAIGVARGKMQRANVLSVQMHGDVMFKRDDGECRLFRGLTSILIEPPFPAVPPVSSRLRTLSCAMSVEPALLNGTFPPVWSP